MTQQVVKTAEEAALSRNREGSSSSSSGMSPLVEPRQEVRALARLGPLAYLMGGQGVRRSRGGGPPKGAEAGGLRPQAGIRWEDGMETVGKNTEGGTEGRGGLRQRIEAGVAGGGTMCTAGRGMGTMIAIGLERRGCMMNERIGGGTREIVRRGKGGTHKGDEGKESWRYGRSRSR
jgi:hypothetical protein